MAEFDASELELLLCGLPAIDLEDWKANVEYRSGYGPAHAVIKRFWQVVEEMEEQVVQVEVAQDLIQFFQR